MSSTPPPASATQAPTAASAVDPMDALVAGLRDLAIKPAADTTTAATTTAAAAAAPVPASPQASEADSESARTFAASTDETPIAVETLLTRARLYAPTAEAGSSLAYAHAFAFPAAPRSSNSNDAVAAAGGLVMDNEPPAGAGAAEGYEGAVEKWTPSTSTSTSTGELVGPDDVAYRALAPQWISKNAAGTTALFFDARVLLHQANYSHVEGPLRVIRSFERLVADGIWAQCSHVIVGGPQMGGMGALSAEATPEDDPAAGNITGDTHAPPAFAKDIASYAAIEAFPAVSPLYAALLPVLAESSFLAAHAVTHTSKVSASALLLYGSDEEDSEEEDNNSSSGSARKLKYPDCKYIDGDTYTNAFTAAAARVAVSGVVHVCRAVAAGHAKNGFALIRPPGHHASADKAAGFCLYNNVAVAVRDLQRAFPGDVKRVLVVDWDVHHGDGTQAIFDEDPSVLFVSLHRFGNGFYPGTGKSEEIGSGAGAGFTMNIPLPPTMGDVEYTDAFDRLIMPVAREFAPDFVIISAGFDCLAGDPLGGMEVTPGGLAQITARLQTLAKGRVVAALEGGYDPVRVAGGVSAVAAQLCGARALIPAAVTDGYAGLEKRDAQKRAARVGIYKAALEATAKALSHHWPSAMAALKTMRADAKSAAKQAATTAQQGRWPAPTSARGGGNVVSYKN